MRLNLREREELDLELEESPATPYCGVCLSALKVETDPRSPEKIWLTCLECKKLSDSASELESLVATLEEKWLKAERLYNDLQAYVSTMVL